MGRRIGDHDAGEIGPRLLCFFTQIGEIDVAVFITGNDHYLHTRHLRGSRVGAVRGARDQADIAMAFVAALVIMANRQQASIFTLRAGVRLHADGVIAGQFHQPVGKLGDHLLIPFRLLDRAERVQLGEFRPGDRDHLRRGVQFHGAGAQRDHRLVQRQIFTLQGVHVAHHLGFAMVAVKHRMGEDRIVAQHRRRDRTAIQRHVFIQGIDIQTVIVADDGAEQVQHIFAGGRFIERNAHRAVNIAAQVNLQVFGTRQHRSFIRHFDAQGVEVVGMTQLQPFLLQAVGQNVGQTMNATSDTFQTRRAVEYRVQAGDVGQQHLRGTNVGVRFLTADVLLASLHRHAQRGIPRRIFRYADNPARHGAFEFIFRREEGRVRAAVAHRHAEALGGTENDIRALLARRRQQHQRHKVGGDADNHFARFQLGDQFAVIVDFAGGAHLLQQHAEDILVIEHFVGVIDDHVEAEGFRAGAHHVQGLRMDIGGNEEAVGALQFTDAFGHRHRFGGGGGFIKQRSGSDIQPGQIQSDLLEVEQRLQTALGYFRLVRGIGGIPARVFQHVALNDRRQLHGGIAHADVRLEALVATGNRLQLRQRGEFGSRVAHLWWGRQLDILRHNLADQGVKRIRADGLQHLLLLLSVRANVTFNKGVAVFKLT